MDPLSGDALVIKGRPERLDAVIKPIAFVAMAGLGLIGTTLLVYAGEWFWVPVPLAGGILLHGIIFMIRGDRPILCSITGSGLNAVDRKGGRELGMELSTVVHAGLSVRQVPNTERDLAYIVLYDASGPQLALRLSTPRRAWPRHAVPLDALQPVLGGNAGVLRGLAPADRIVRQVLDDDNGELAASILRHVPAEAWERVVVRVWVGDAPPVDFMGLHQGPADALLVFREDADGVPIIEVLEGPGPASVPPGRHAITGDRGGRASRLLSLLSLPGQEARLASLPVIVWDISEALQLVIPSPIGGHCGEEVELSDTGLHTHLGEGAHAVWWLMERLAQIPDGLREAISDARVATSTLHPTLSRHLPDEAPTGSGSKLGS